MNTAQCVTPSSIPSSMGYGCASIPTLSTRVGAAFHAALDHGASSDELRVSTRAFVEMLKAEGRSPERTLVALKDILMRESPCVSLAPVCCANQASMTIEQRVYAQVFGWYLDAYYRDRRPSTESMVR